jgi:hypothetical protein
MDTNLTTDQPQFICSEAARQAVDESRFRRESAENKMLADELNAAAHADIIVMGTNEIRPRRAYLLEQIEASNETRKEIRQQSSFRALFEPVHQDEQLQPSADHSQQKVSSALDLSGS